MKRLSTACSRAAALMRDPQAVELALALLAVAVGVDQALLDREAPGG
jgi:hypothetical protein